MSQRHFLAAGLVLALASPALAQSATLLQAESPDPSPGSVLKVAPEVAPDAAAEAAQDAASQPAPEETAEALDTEPADTKPAPLRTFMFEQTATEIGIMTLMGMDVFSTQGEKLGTVDDVVINQRGQVQGLLLATGGFLGFGAKSVGINWSAVRQTLDRKVLTVDLSSQQLAEAPAYLTQEDLKAAAEAELRAQQLDPRTGDQADLPASLLGAPSAEGSVD